MISNDAGQADGLFSERNKKSHPEENPQDLTTLIASQPNDGAMIRINKGKANTNLKKKIAEKYRNIRSSRGFLGDLKRALGADSGVKQSQYFSLSLPEGDLTLRISNHNAKDDNFRPREHVISIVVKPRRTRRSHYFYSYQDSFPKS